MNQNDHSPKLTASLPANLNKNSLVPLAQTTGSSKNMASSTFFNFTSERNLTLVQRDVQLDSHAPDFLNNAVEILQNKIPLKDRKVNFKTYKNSFLGSELIDWAVSLRIVPSRTEAKMLAEKCLSDKMISGSSPFQDSSSSVYTFTSMSSVSHSSVSSASDDQEELETLAQDLSKGIEIRDRTYRLKTYKNVFVGKQAVDWICSHRPSIQSRVEAVALGQKMMDFGLFVHAAGRNSFADEELFYRFAESNRLRPQPQTSVPLTTSTSSKDLSSSFSSIDSREVVSKMAASLQIKNRTWKLIKFKNCFTATEAIDWMIRNLDEINTRQDAVVLGNQLLKRGNIVHVSGRTTFEDGEFFYRFKDELFVDNPEYLLEKMRGSIPLRDRTQNLKKYKNTFLGRDATDWLLNQSELDLPISSRKDAVLVGQQLVTSGLLIPVTGKKFEDSESLFRFIENQDSLMSTEVSLYDIICDWKSGVKISDRKWKLTTYRSCFVASEGVSWLVANIPQVQTREQAVILGQVAINQGLIQHVAGKFKFKDGEYFYRFAYEECPLKAYGQSLKTLVEQLSGNVSVQKRRYRFTTYDDCFVASEAVDWMVNSVKNIANRSAATRLGQFLLEEGYISHVAGKNVFDDGFYFYFFTNTSTVTLQLKSTLEDIEETLKKNVKLSTRRTSSGKTKQAFLSNDAVEILLREIQEIGNIREAYILGQVLLDEGLIYHLDFQPKFQEGNWFCLASALHSHPSSLEEILPLPELPPPASQPPAALPQKGSERKAKKNRLHLSILVPKKQIQPSHTGAHKFFGQPLLQVLAQDHVLETSCIPKVIERCLTILSRTESLETEGLFRISSASEYTQLCNSIDSGQAVDLEAYADDAHIVANIFKKWIRDLPEPLLTFQLFSQFSLLPDNMEEFVPRSKELIKQLPLPNLKIATVLFNFLHIVSTYAATNKMHSRNLGTVFSPLLLRSPDFDPTSLVLYSTSLTEVIQNFVDKAHEIF